MPENVTSISSLKILIKRRIDQLPEKDLQKTAKILNALIISYKYPDAIQEKLNDFVCKSKPSSKENRNIRDLFEDRWKEITEGQKLTKALIKYFEESCTNPDQYLVTHKNGDSRTGYYFEDKFADLLKLFLCSRAECIDKKNQSKFEVKLNEYQNVKGYAHQQKPDIVVSGKKSKTIFFISELKKSFSKSTLKHVYQKQITKWQSFPNAKFLFIIFCVSPSKVKTYKKNEECRIICSGLRTNQTLLNNKNEPLIHNSIEDIFSEILIHLTSV